MTQADSVHSTPPLKTSATNPTAGLDWLDIAADAKPADIFRAIGRLRKEARDEIERLIHFLDESDNHMEAEPNGDELDGSWPESGAKAPIPWRMTKRTTPAKLTALATLPSVSSSVTVVSTEVSTGQTLLGIKNAFARALGMIWRTNTTAPSLTRTESRLSVACQAFLNFPRPGSCQRQKSREGVNA
jgi:hypothetical protein